MIWRLRISRRLNFFASVGERYATTVTYKQSNPDFIFRLSDVAADRRFLNHEFGGGFSKATFVCSSEHIALILPHSLRRGCWHPAYGHYLNRRALLVAAPIMAKPVSATKQKTAP
jgi:hypothetical protein